MMRSFSMRASALMAVLMGCQAAIAAQQDLYVSSAGTNSIKRYDGITGAYIGDFVTAGSGGLVKPQGCLFGPDGNLYVTGAGNPGVMRYNGSTGVFMGVFTSGASLGFGADMSFHNGSLYVSDFSSIGHVYRFDQTTGVLQSDFASDHPPVPDGLSWDSAGNLYVSTFTGTIRRYDSSGAALGVFATLPTGGQALDNRFGDDGNLYVSDFNRGSIDMFNGTNGAYMGDFITGLGQAQGMAIGPDGGLYVGSYSNATVNEYNATSGAFIRAFASGGGAFHTNDFTFGPAAVPEPMSLCALAIGFAGLARKRVKKLLGKSRN